MALLDHLRDRSPATSGNEGTTGNSRQPTRPEAFSEALRLAGDALASDGSRSRWTDRFAITVTVDAEVLAGLRPGQGTLLDGTTVDPLTIRGWMPSSTLRGLLSDKGRPLHLGRTVRLATAAQKRTLLIRDGGCAFPGCCRRDHLNAHHVVEWIDGGPTSVDNMVLLCRTHHRMLHRGEFTITMVDGFPQVDTAVDSFATRRPSRFPLSAEEAVQTGGPGSRCDR